MQFWLVTARFSVCAAAVNQNETPALGKECYCVEHWVKNGWGSLRDRAWTGSVTLSHEFLSGVWQGVCAVTWRCGGAVGAGWGVHVVVCLVQSLPREMELRLHCVNLTKLPLPFLGVDAEGKGEKLHLCWLSGLHLHFFLFLCPFFVKEFSFWAFQPLSWYKSYLLCVVA